MAPPKFGDLSKKVNDLLSDDFPSGFSQLTCKSKAANGAEFKVEGKKTNDDNKLSAFLEAKYSTSGGIDVKEKWSTSNVVNTELSINDLLTSGTKFTFASAISPTKGLQSCNVKVDYKMDGMTSNINASSNSVAANSVLNFGQFLFGISGKYNTSQGNVSPVDAGFGYSCSDYNLSAVYSNFDTVTASLFHSPQADVDAGVQFSWNTKSNETTMCLAGKLQLDRDAFVKAKVDKNIMVGLSYNQVLRDGVTVTLGAKVNGKNLNADGHQLGFALKFDN